MCLFVYIFKSKIDWKQRSNKTVTDGGNTIKVAKVDKLNIVIYFGLKSRICPHIKKKK